MEDWTQGRVVAAIFFVVLCFQNGDQVTSDRIEEDCGLSYIQVVKDDTLKKEAAKEGWKGSHSCKVVYKSADSSMNLYLLFKKFDCEPDCEVNMELFWGAEQGKAVYDCNSKPEIEKAYFVEGEYNLTLTISKVDASDKNFDIQFEVTTTDIAPSLSTNLIGFRMSAVTIVTLALCAIVLSTLRRC